LLHGSADGHRIMESVARIVDTDRWNSFDRFHETTRTIADHYRSVGAQAEVHAIQTGGRIGSGRWIIHEAQDVLAATVDVVSPVTWRVLDFKENPFHIVQWSSGTPAGGMTSELVIADTVEELDRLRPGRLAGKTLLTRLNLRDLFKLLSDKCAAGVICDRPVPGLPDATAWNKFGWGGIPLENAAIRLVGLSISENRGKELRRLVAEHGRLRLRARVDVRRYVGTHDVVSGIILGRDDPQDEVWAIAHSDEPGAQDNASGGAVCMEVAHVIQGLVDRGELPRPRRSIRLVHGYECYGFFNYLENVHRFQPPLAGVCVDSVGARLEMCGRRLEWHQTIPMSAGFVNHVGQAILRAGLRLGKPGYRLFLAPFVSTHDTLIGDPKYGFPCPWITTYRGRGRHRFRAYHSSADVAQDILSPEGLAACATGIAAYLYYLADAATPEVLELASAETGRAVEGLRAGRRKMTAAQAGYWLDEHRASLERLTRWLWGGGREAILSHLSACEERVRAAARDAVGPARPRKRVPAAAKRIPRRTAFLSPTLENTPAPLADRIRASKVNPWALFWADGARDLARVADAVSCERSEDVDLQQVMAFFEAHADLRYAELVGPGDMVTRARLVRDLKALGLERGMDVVAHSSLSRIGHVVGGPDAVIDAILSAIGKEGTLMLPSFNHGRAKVFNPLATPTTNGAIPDAAWRRPDAVRSLHPTHPVVAIGPRAEEFCGGHLEAGIWAADSPLGKLIHGGGYILSIGVSQVYSTAYHVAEVSIPCPCIDQFGGTGYVVERDGTVRAVKGLAWRSSPCPVPVSKLDEALDERGLQRRGKVGHAESRLVKAIDLWKMRREHLGDTCSACTVRPGPDL
jgi:aminoglycoside 3-N-acetyltransferase